MIVDYVSAYIYIYVYVLVYGHSKETVAAIMMLYKCYIITEGFFYTNHFMLFIFYHSVWLGFELFGS